MTGLGRLKDLADVQELVRLLNLPREFRERLDPYVQDRFDELWLTGRRRYVKIWPYDAALGKPTTMQELIGLNPANVSALEAMQADGVLVDPTADTEAGVASLVTLDLDVAVKYEMRDETDL